MDEIAGRFARLAPLRAVALCAMGAAALLAPDVRSGGLACAAIGYLLLTGVILAARSCAGGPRSLASRVGLAMACLLLALAGVSVALVQQLQSRVMLYLGLLLVEGAVYLAMGLGVFRSAGLSALASVVMVGSLLWMLAAPFGGLVNLHRCLGALLLLSAAYELAARALWKRRAWGMVL